MASASGSSSTALSFPAMARVRTSAWSMVRLAVSSCLFTFPRTSPNLPNSLLTAPRISHTSQDRCSMARVWKPMRRLLRMAARVVGPASMIRNRC